uniref:Uncharacterized protein n=1 Tax=Globodera rostochiensis TaxID=31243 RepID=A0A914H7U8_GLORO
MHWLQTLLISDFPENPNLCYKWTKGGGNKTSLKEERSVTSALDAERSKTQNKLETIPNCRPGFGFGAKKSTSRIGTGNTRNRRFGTRPYRCRVAQKYNDVAEETREGIRDSACGNTIATRKAIFFKSFKENYKSKTFQQCEDPYPFGPTLNTTFVADAPWTTRSTKLTAFDEMLMRYLDEELALFSSPRLLSLLKEVVQANFDFEPASVQAFSEQFPAIAKKNRFIRMIGAHQFVLQTTPTAQYRCCSVSSRNPNWEVDSELGVIPPMYPAA